MIAYKGARNTWCRDLKYEVGKTYIFKGDLKLCERGFHACNDIVDVDKYYPFDDPDTVVLEVEVPNDAVIIKSFEDSKFVTDKIKVLRILTKDDIERISNGDVKFNKAGKIEYIKYPTGYWEKRKYDEKGNLVYRKCSDGYYEKWKYDERGNAVYKFYHTWLRNYWIKRKFDENGNEIYYKDSDGVEYEIEIV